MAKQAYVYSGTDWVPLASEVTNLSSYYTKGEIDILDAPTGLKLIVPSSISVGSGTGSVSATGTITLSGVSSVSINNCFSSAYDNYEIVVNVSGSAFQTGTIRLRVAGADDSSSVYDYCGQYQSSASTVWQNVGAAQSQTSWLGFNYGTNGLGYNRINIYNPFSANRTLFFAETHEPGTSSLTVTRNGQFRGTTSFTGISFTQSGGSTFTGSIQVYGYKV